MRQLFFVNEWHLPGQDVPETQSLKKGDRMDYFISDMDGTLLDGRGCLSENTIRILRPLIEKGLHFTVATARTPLSAVPLLSALSVREPMILMNGALLYEPQEGRFFSFTGFGEAAMAVLTEAEQDGVEGMLFTAEEEMLCIYLGNVKHSMWDGYFDWEAAQIPALSRTIRSGSAASLSGKEVIYALYMDDEPKALGRMAEHLSGCQELTVDFYKDQYTKNRWCLELCSSAASKGRAVRCLRERIPEARFWAFGDSRNDIPLFEACDRALAVANACEELKMLADEVILSNTKDGVAKFVKEYGESLALRR